MLKNNAGDDFLIGNSILPMEIFLRPYNNNKKEKIYTKK